MSDVELKPCPNPHCKSINLECLELSRGFRKIRCKDCSTSGPIVPPECSVHEYWEELPRQPDPAPLVEAYLEGALAQLDTYDDEVGEQLNAEAREYAAKTLAKHRGKK